MKNLSKKILLVISILSIGTSSAINRASSFGSSLDCPPELGLNIQVSGSEAEKLMVKIMDTEGAELVENSVNITTWKLRNISCTLFGSHGGAVEPPSYQCRLDL